ncbi:MAG: glycosyltransferase [bacterium]|nr:glycosyltransferase [bacterium]
MSRFLFATFGSLGDLHPYIAIARVLKDRGHEVIIASAEDHRLSVEQVGIEFAAVPPSISDLGGHQAVITQLFTYRNGPGHLMRHLVMPYVKPAYEHLLQASAGADLLISHPLTVTLSLVAQRRAIPWVSTVLAPLSFLSNFDPPVLAGAPWLHKLRVFGEIPYRGLLNLLKRTTWSWEAPLRTLREELGLPPSKQMAMFEGQFSPLRTLALFDPQLAQPQPDWPSNTCVCGCPVFDGPAQDIRILDELERFLAEGDPPIVFALGSAAVWIAGDFWENAIAATQRLNRRAILITGPHTPESLPENIRAFPYLPYSSVFPHAAAIVHQAGIGTLSQALRAGRPQLIVPVAFDQFDNAHRTQKLGLGRVLPFRKVAAQRLTSQLEQLFKYPGHAQAAHTLAHELAGTDGAARAADELISCIQS